MGKDKPTEIKPLAINDRVITPISNRSGTIVKIEETPLPPNSLSWCNTRATFKEYTVEVKLPHTDYDLFKVVRVMCQEAELKRV